MSAMIPLDGSAKLPAYLTQNLKNPAFSSVNADVLQGGPSFPYLSIKGKTWTVIQNGEKKMLTVEQDGDQVPRSSVKLVTIRVNKNARTFYSGGYDPNAEGQRPTCYTNDGVAPAADATEPQSKKCAICPHAAKGSKVSEDGNFKSTACQRNTRAAVMDPEHPDTKMLLRLPPKSHFAFTDATKILQNRNIPYNAAVFHVKFEPTEASPVLVFKPVGLVDDSMYEQIQKLYDSDEIKEICGLGGPAEVEDRPALPAPSIDTDELDAAIKAKAVTEKAQAKAQVETAVLGGPDAPKPAKAAAEKAEKPAKKPPVEVEDAGSLLADLDALLGGGSDD